MIIYIYIYDYIYIYVYIYMSIYIYTYILWVAGDLTLAALIPFPRFPSKDTKSFAAKRLQDTRLRALDPSAEQVPAKLYETGPRP